MTLPRVLFVTGKGGTGKSTVAAALALARSRRRPTTLADLDRRMCAAAMLGVTSVDATAAKVTESLEVVALETEANMRERLSITTVAAIMNRVADPLFNTAELAALSPLRIHAQLAIR